MKCLQIQSLHIVAANMCFLFLLHEAVKHFECVEMWFVIFL